MRLADGCPACLCYSFDVLPDGALAPFVSYRTGLDASLGQSCECRQCGLMFSRVRFDDDECRALYADYRGPSYNRDRDIFEPGYSRQHAHLNERRDYMADVEWFVAEVFGVPLTVLDIGANDGGNTPFGESARVTAIDVGMGIPDGRFDLVALAHVLEHVSEPSDLLEVARSRGPVYVEVPLEPRTHIWHEHVQRFDHRSIKALLRRVDAYQEMQTSLGPVAMALTC